MRARSSQLERPGKASGWLVRDVKRNLETKRVGNGESDAPAARWLRHGGRFDASRREDWHKGSLRWRRAVQYVLHWRLGGERTGKYVANDVGYSVMGPDKSRDAHVDDPRNTDRQRRCERRCEWEGTVGAECDANKPALNTRHGHAQGGLTSGYEHGPNNAQTKAGDKAPASHTKPASLRLSWPPSGPPFPCDASFSQPSHPRYPFSTFPGPPVARTTLSARTVWTHRRTHDCLARQPCSVLV